MGRCYLTKFRRAGTPLDARAALTTLSIHPKRRAGVKFQFREREKAFTTGHAQPVVTPPQLNQAQETQPQ